MLSLLNLMILGINSVPKLSLFISYVLLWTSQSILVHLANKRGIIYNPISAVFMQDLGKLMITGILFVSTEGNIFELLKNVKQFRILFLLYLIPAGLYAIYNNLTFYALSRFDPSSYFVLMQFKIVVTALLSVLVLGKVITKYQWVALFVIMFGSMLKESSAIFSGEVPNRSIADYLVILVQLLISAFAGIYNEKLLKGVSATPNVQNVFMYVDGIICNSLALIFRGELLSALSQQNLATLASPNILAIILNFSVVGVVTGFFIKHLGNVLKTIAGALELWTVAILSALIFGYPITFSAAIGIAFVSFGVWLYSYDPVTSSYQPIKVSDTESSKMELQPLK